MRVYTHYDITLLINACQTNMIEKLKWKRLNQLGIGETGLEPATSASQTQRSSHLNYSPYNSEFYHNTLKKGRYSPLSNLQFRKP